MELKDLFSIFVQYCRLFWGVLCLFLLGGVVFFFLQNQNYRADLVLNVTRAGSASITEYQYDDFYRLQADERFSDTIVQWVKSARFEEDIFKKTQSHLVSVRRLSSQVIEVKFSTPYAKDAEVVAQSVLQEINRNAQQLNVAQKQENWFVVQGNEPVVRDGKVPFDIIFLLSGCLGLFFAFWSVLLWDYLKKL